MHFSHSIVDLRIRNWNFGSRVLRLIYFCILRRAVLLRIQVLETKVCLCSLLSSGVVVIHDAHLRAEHVGCVVVIWRHQA